MSNKDIDNICKEAQEVLRTAARMEQRGDKASALLMRNVAWRIENDCEWLAYIEASEAR